MKLTPLTIMLGLLGVKLAFAATEAVTGNAPSSSGVDPVDAAFGCILIMSVASGAPHPDVLKDPGMRWWFFAYLWFYGSTNALCQNLGKAQHQPLPPGTQRSTESVTTVVTAKNEAGPPV